MILSKKKSELHDFLNDVEKIKSIRKNMSAPQMVLAFTVADIPVPVQWHPRKLIQKGVVALIGKIKHRENYTTKNNFSLGV